MLHLQLPFVGDNLLRGYEWPTAFGKNNRAAADGDTRRATPEISEHSWRVIVNHQGIMGAVSISRIGSAQIEYAGPMGESDEDE